MKARTPVPAWLEVGKYRNWELVLATRFPLALSEMRWPSKPPESFDSQPLAQCGIDIMAGWRPILVRLLEQLEMVIEAQPVDERDRFRILQIKEKFGRLTVYTADSTPDMDVAIQAAADESVATCEVCGAPGELKERNHWWAPRCKAWRPRQVPE